MGIRGLSLLSSCLALAACQALPPAAQDVASRPHARVAGSHVDADADRVSTFRVTAIDGWPVNREANQDPSKTLGVDLANEVAAGRSVKVAFEGLTRYRNSVRSLFWSTYGVDGSVEFVPAADARYVVRGEIGPGGSSVWLENDATHEVVGQKFSAAPPAAASAPKSAVEIEQPRAGER